MTPKLNFDAPLSAHDIARAVAIGQQRRQLAREYGISHIVITVTREPDGECDGHDYALGCACNIPREDDFCRYILEQDWTLERDKRNWRILRELRVSGQPLPTFADVYGNGRALWQESDEHASANVVADGSVSA